MRVIAIITVVAILAGCAATGRSPAYLNKDGNAASWGEGKREINSSLTQTSSKW